MKNVMGGIYTGEKDSFLRELTLLRAIAAMPVAGRYRVIDFLVSGMVNSGIRNVGVIMQKNYHSLMDHLGSGKEWDLHGKHDGLFILPPFLTRDNVGVYGGMLDALRSNIGYLRRSRQEYVLLTDSHVIYNIDYLEMLRQHVDSGADITLLYHDAKPRLQQGVHEYRVYFDTNADGLITALEIDPVQPSFPNESLSAMIIRRELLVSIVAQTAAQGHHSFVRDVLQRSVNDQTLRVMGYRSPVRGWHIDSVQSYYRFNMDTLQADVRQELFDPRRPVYTKVRDDMAARYGDSATVSNSLVADGGRIEGTVENSIIFRGVYVAAGAIVRNSIVMQDAQVHEDAEIDHCILDKQAVIKHDGKLIGPSAYPIVISKNMII